MWISVEILFQSFLQEAIVSSSGRGIYRREWFSSVQSLDRLGRRGDMRDDSAEIFFQSFLQEATTSSFGIGRDIYSLSGQA